VRRDWDTMNLSRTVKLFREGVEYANTTAAIDDTTRWQKQERPRKS
jgi:hypothetical protein